MTHDVFPIADYGHGPADIMAVGNFGVLYRAYWRPRGIHVALKHVPRKSEAGRKVEAEARGALLQQAFGRAHPGIVPEIYEHGLSGDGDYYISMEMLDGRALSTHLKEAPVPHEQALRIARWIAGDFLANLHAFRGGGPADSADMIVYSDLKPDHIFLLRDGSVRALDFGITKRVQQANTSTVNPWASVPYASPRRLREGVVDRDADFWALGVILYEMIAGHHLYPGLSAEAMSRAIERQDPPAPLPPCDPRIAAIIRKLLAPQRHESYQRAEDIAADLQTVLDGGVPAASSARISTSVPTAKVPRGYDRDALPAPGSVPTEPVPPGARLDGAPRAALPAPAPAAAPRRRKRRLLRAAIIFGVIFMIFSQASEWARVEDFRAGIGSIEASSLADVREQLREFGRSPASAPSRVREPLTDRLITLADRPILDFRTELPAVAQKQWEEARECLALASELSPGDSRVTARLKLVEAHLSRIAASGLPAQAGRLRLEQAANGFRDAARLDRSSPDPYLGLARIHAYDLKDFDALMTDLREAQERGHRETRRERSQMADAYRFRADRARLRARPLKGEAQIALLREAAEDYETCADRFDALGSFLDSERNARVCRQQHGRVLIEIERLIFTGFLGRFVR